MKGGPTAEAIRSAVEDLRPWSQERLLELVACASLQGHERSAQDVVQRVLSTELGMTIDRWALDAAQLATCPGFSPVDWDLSQSECVVGTYDAANPAARSLIINGHVDVVPVAPTHLWTKQPFDPYVKDGWLYGRGSGDMKG